MDDSRYHHRDKVKTFGPMADLVEAFDWAATSIGAREKWPHNLQTVVDLMLATPQLATLAVGPDRIFLYNDEAARHYGARHPLVLGKPLAEAFPHEFHHVAHFYDRVFAGESVQVRTQPLDPAQTGTPEVFDAYLAPVRDAAGKVIAAYVTCVAIDPLVRAEAALRESQADLAHELANTRLLQEVSSLMIEGGDDEALYGRILDAAMAIMEADFASLQILDQERNDLRLLGHKNFHHESARFWDRVSIATGSTCAGALREGERTIVLNAPEYDPHGRRSYELSGITSVQSTPLTTRGGRLIGMISTHWRKPTVPDEAQFRWFDILARQTADAFERSRAEMALRESQRIQSAMLEVLPLGLAMIRSDRSVILSNPEWARFAPTGRVPSGDNERRWRWRTWDEKGELVHSENFPAARALRGEQVLPGLQFLYTEDSGREIWTKVAAVPVRNENGEVVAAFAIIEDIDAAKRATDAARESEERLLQFGNASQDILWMRDAATMQWQYLTPAFETIYGLRREEALTGDDYRNWQDLIVPEDRDHAVSSIGRVLAGEWVTFEYRIRRPSDGSIRWLRNTDFPIRDKDGRISLIGGIGHDFTDVREAELRLQTLVEGMPQLVWRAVDGGEWTWASPQWTAYTGQPEAEYRDWGWLQAVHPDDRAGAREAWSQALTTGGFQVEFRIKRQHDGEYCWFQTRAAPVCGPGGTVTEWLGTSTDINDLRASQELKKMLLAELQHRVRNILAVIRSIVRRSDDGERSSEEYVHHLEGRISALARTQVLLTRHPGAGVYLEDMIRDELLVQVASEEQFSLHGPELKLSAKAAEVLTLAIHELATNATKYGAFSRTSGRLDLNWKVERRNGLDWLNLHWAERGVPIIDAAPRRRGFGAELISQRIPYELKGHGSFKLKPGGLESRIEFPLVPGESILQTDGVHP